MAGRRKSQKDLQEKRNNHGSKPVITAANSAAQPRRVNWRARLTAANGASNTATASRTRPRTRQQSVTSSMGTLATNNDP